MQEQQRVDVFRAQTKNAQELERSWRHINRQLNALLLTSNNVAVHVNTKVLALIYCALAEALFSKILHTPKGLTLDEIQQVKVATKAGGVKEGWIKCVELAMRSVQGAKGSHGPNVKQRLQRFIEEFIFDPSLLRNKLAHGQWCIALNRDNDAVNAQLTSELAALDVVEIYRRKSALQRLSAILEDIIESPNKAHHRDYWDHLDKFENDQQEMAAWSLAKKIEQLRTKAAYALSNV
ncbi:hypothetical protein EV679_2152 [Kerstersia gyiorum]|uniref:Uncharacterized protein n=1 Tax=Kerstersia gyiorum TaxID=206506 RepID=A0A4Q7MRP7_9BURK|nr:hypothetical protein [Kerstersia gyiorum]KAB0544425.1 hypothetical protein F7P85_02995 [Kerstersia gyiorum]RZS69552.1 hypothetical protein EV679_2152 [Kerstersia gyiorum]